MVATAIVLLAAASGARGQDLGAIGSADPFGVDGNISARLLLYGADGIAERRSPFSYILSGSVYVDLYDLSLPFSFTFSEQERSVAQPFNQFGVSPRYQWITAHLGYRNLTFSPFTLAGHQMLGAGVELNPGMFRLGFIAGELMRAVEEDTASLGQTPAYGRTGFGGRIGFGTESSHLDLIVLKGVDDTASLRAAPQRSDIRPAENLVLGASAAAAIIDGLSFRADVAVSDYTRDLRSDRLDLGTETEMLAGVISPRASTQIYTALSAGFSLNIETFNMQASYTRIDPDYQSMGAYYLANDLEQFSVTPSIALLESTLFLNGSFSLQHDNIQGKKRATTQRIVPSLSLYYAPGPTWGISLQAADMLASQTAGALPLSDTIRIAQRNPSVSISPRYTIVQDSSATHTLGGSVNYGSLIDDNRFTALYSEYTSVGADLSYGLDLPASATTLNGSISMYTLSSAHGDVATWAVSAGGSRALMERTLDVDGSLAVSFHEDGPTINGSLGGTWRPAEHHTAGMSVSLTTSGGSGNATSSFNEYTTVLSYVYSF